MIDPRFYEALGPLAVRALAPSGEIGGDADRMVSSVAPADHAGPDDLCYYEPKGQAPLASTPAACVIRPAAAHLAPKAGALILTDAPRSVFARIAAKLARPRSFASDIAIDPTARLEPGVRIAHGAVIGPDAQIGADAVIGPN